MPKTSALSAYYFRTALAVLLLAHSLALCWSGFCHSPTNDELAHLVAGDSHLQFGRFELYRVNPPLVRCIAAVPFWLAGREINWAHYGDTQFARAEFGVANDFVSSYGSEVFWHVTVARWACIPLSLLGAAVCFGWASDLYGRRAGLFALILWCASPTVLGHGALITPDMGAAAIGTAACYAFWRWLRRPGAGTVLVAGVLLGLAELAKSTWLILFLIWPLIYIATPGVAKGRKTRPRGSQLLVILIAGWVIVNTGYAWRGSFSALLRFRFVSRALGGRDAHESPGNRFVEMPLGWVPVPLPADYVRGIDIQRREFERGTWSYLDGEFRRRGWWYYYLRALTLKEPVGTLSLCAAAVVAARSGRWRARFRWRRESALVLPLVAVACLVSAETGLNQHFRYFFPVLPLLFIWASRVACGFRRPALRAAMWGLLGLAVVESASVCPHSLSFFNWPAGGPFDGGKHLLDSNIDWGQDLLYLRRWINAHKEARPMRIAYFGPVHLRDVGLDFEQPAPRATTNATVSLSDDFCGPKPGWYAVSVNYVRGYRTLSQYEPDYSYFKNFTPVAYAGYSIYIYHITGEECARVRRTMGTGER